MVYFRLNVHVLLGVRIKPYGSISVKETRREELKHT